MFNLDVTELHKQHDTNASGNFRSVMNTTINPRGGGIPLYGLISIREKFCWGGG